MADSNASLASKVQSVFMMNPSVTPEQLAEGFGVSVDDIQAALSTPFDPNKTQAILSPYSPLDTAGWDEATRDYYTKLMDYRQKLSDMGFIYEDPYLNPQPDPTLSAMGIGMPNFGLMQYQSDPQAYYKNLMQTSADPTSAFQPYTYFTSPTGEGQSEWFGKLTAEPNKQYRLVDTNNDQVVYSGTGLEALQKMKEMVPSLSTKPSETWSLDVSDVGADNWKPTGVQKVNSSTPWFIKAFPYALGALATAGALGAFGGVGGAASGAGGAGAGAAGGATAAGTAGLGAASVAPALGEIVVTGALPTAASLGGTLAGLGAGIGGGLAASSGAGSTAGGGFDGITVSHAPVSGLTLGQGVPGIGAGGLAAAMEGVSPGASNYLDQLSQDVANPSDIVVTGGKTVIPSQAAAAAAIPLAPEIAQAAAQPKPAAKSDTFSNILRGASLIDALIGGGGGNASATPGAGGRLGPIFSSKLPTTSSIPTARQPFAVMPDMTRYGRGTPSLAAQVPQYGGSLPPGFDPETLEWLGPQKEETKAMMYGGYAEGGVDGPGDGRSDSIPAQLSDGEYVIDAETVALLGNGSNKAGAKKLDQFRVNIRRQKGRHLAKGKFSVNAKRPESYLGAK